VTLPVPRAGLVLRYSYLWVNEHEEGQEEGAKDRPCAVIAAVRTDQDGKIRVLVIPITHTPPAGAEAIEIPPTIKARLNLDFERSWIILSEANEFFWPGPDLRPVPGSNPPEFAYGMLPPRFFSTVRDRFLKIFRAGQARRVPRTE
jgi:hypothetical protein